MWTLLVYMDLVLDLTLICWCSLYFVPLYRKNLLISRFCCFSLISLNYFRTAHCAHLGAIKACSPYEFIYCARFKEMRISIEVLFYLVYFHSTLFRSSLRFRFENDSIFFVRICCNRCPISQSAYRSICAHCTLYMQITWIYWVIQGWVYKTFDNNTEKHFGITDKIFNYCINDIVWIKLECT